MNSSSFIESLSNLVFEDNASFPFSEKTHPLVKQNPQSYRRRYETQLSVFDIFNFKKLKIADIGGGIGIHAEYMRLKGHDVCMYEPNVEYCNIASKHFPNLHIVNDYFDHKMYDMITFFSPETEFENSINIDPSFLKRNCVMILVDQRALKFNRMLSEIGDRIVYRHDHFTHDCMRRTILLRTFQIESEMLRNYLYNT
jgi:hypothetical protein